MAKLKVSKKEMKSSYKQIIGIGYCNAQHLLQYKPPFAYSCGINGWYCDYYDIDGVLLSSGYSHVDNKNVSCDFKLVHEYNSKAEKFRYSNLSYEEKKCQVEKLLKEFVKKCIS